MILFFKELIIQEKCGTETRLDDILQKGKCMTNIVGTFLDKYS